MEQASFPEQFFQVFSKFSLDFFVVELGARDKMLYCSCKGPLCYGYPFETFIDQEGGFLGNLVLGADQARVATALQVARGSKADIDLQLHLIRFDTSVSLVHLAGTYLYSQQETPVYLFLLSDEKNVFVAPDTKLESFRICFSVDTGSLIEVNLQARIAFLVNEFTNIYEAITLFSSHYVHPQDRKAFAAFSDRRTLVPSATSTGKLVEIPFRRTSYNELFSGYRWALLSYSLEVGGEGQDLVCEVLIQDSDKASSKLAEKTMQTLLDPLTRLLNRSALEAQVTQQIEFCGKEECIGAFFMLDIDQFKWINDTFGHDFGDEVLCQVANAIKGVFRPSDIVARLGGDEFAVFVTGIPSTELALLKAENICQALRDLKTSQKSLHLSCSVGIAIFPKHGTSFRDLYHTSDLALYQAKWEGKDRYCLYGISAGFQEKVRPVDREWLFSQLEDEIYLCNEKTFTLLFANDVLLKRLGLTSQRAKGYCYEVLHGRDTPCVDCKHQYEKKADFSTRIRKDPQSKALFLIREKVLLLKGEAVKICISTALPPAISDFLVNNIPYSLFENESW